MPGKHDTENFKFIGLWLDLDLVDHLDRLRGERGRSQYLRDALQDKLEAAGIPIMREKFVAPDRAGKGGPKAKAVSYFKSRTKKLKEPK